MLVSHALAESMITNPSLLPIFQLCLVSSGKDYTGLDNHAQADMQSFIKNPYAVAHMSPTKPNSVVMPKSN